MHVRSAGRAAVVAGLAIAALSGPAFAQGPSAADQQIRTKVVHRLTDQDILRAHDLTIAVSHGVVTLAGTVPTLHDRREAVDETRDVDGVQEVVSRLQVMAGESDRDVAERVARQIRRYVFYTVFDNVNVNVKNGVVTLLGQVTSPFKKREMADLVERVPGAQAVQNDLDVLPTSFYDDELREAVASRIYNDPLFFNDSLVPTPPVHIIVDDSHVTLVGVVSDRMERIRAGMLARDVFGVLGVTNDLRVES
ncbi:MAG: BON domain-containing protein [Acidobacteriota bacterium]|nr:BON domain-containing protein [Acidobacteriota bacterium]